MGHQQGAFEPVHAVKLGNYFWKDHRRECMKQQSNAVALLRSSQKCKYEGSSKANQVLVCWPYLTDLYCYNSGLYLAGS